MVFQGLLIVKEAAQRYNSHLLWLLGIEYIYNSVMHILYYIVIYTCDVTVYLFFLNPVIIRQSVG